MGRHTSGAVQRHGFSLLEVVLGLAILSIFLGMTAVTLRQSIDREGPRALTYTLSADLKAARAEAQRSGKLVAFCLPSDGQTNSFSTTAVLRKGSQKGHVHKILSYGKEYDGFIFAGSWPGTTVETHDTTLGWDTSTASEMVLFFRPDGTAFSKDIPSLQGNYPLLVGSAFTSSSGGPTGVVTAAENPHTVWVSQAGTITVDENKAPVGTLAQGGSEPAASSIAYLEAPATSVSPRIRDIEFLPKAIVGSDSVGMGQNYVNVHPDQKDSERLEYGIATMLIKATDQDGGPLYFDLEAFASRGDIGKFSVSERSGVMHYVYDEETRLYNWQALVSWRPPPGSEEDTEYELRVTVRDEDGNTDTTASGAGLLPKINTLSPVRMVMATTDGHLYLSNIEGGSTIELTDAGAPERDPFFSQDGSRVYSFLNTAGGGQQFRVRNADGSRSYRILRNFSANVSRTLQYDPSYTYVAYIDPTSPAPTIYPHKVPRWVPTDDDGDGYYVLDDANGSYPGRRLEVLHLLADEPPVTITTTAQGTFYWDAQASHTLSFIEAQPLPETTYHPQRRRPPVGQIGPYIAAPGFHEVDRAVRLVGFPPRQDDGIDSGLDASSRSYNPANDHWYVHVDSGDLVLTNRASSTRREIYSGTVVGKPHWSSDGEQIAFVTRNGGDQTVRVVALMEDEPLRPRGSFDERYTYRGNSVHNAQLDPEAKWVFFLQGGDLYRAVNSRGASRVKLSDNLGKALDSYVVSP